MAASKKNISTNPEKCVGCLNCRLMCSFVYEKRFQPSAARIIIEEDDDGVFSITFTDRCNRCGACVEYCVYGALVVSTVGDTA